jgi:GDSL-like Lipase/Acylhydrolase family
MTKNVSYNSHIFLFKMVIVTLTLLISVFILWIYLHNKPDRYGHQLIGRAWIATYTERNLSVPPRGPRDGIVLEKLTPLRDKTIGFHEKSISVPGALEVNKKGLQFSFSPPNPKHHLLIVGASVAYAQYATTTNRTYFNHLSRRLLKQGHKVKITILATRAWTSENELQAFQNVGLSQKPDIVLFLNGLNDLTQYPQLPEHQRVKNYLQRMEKARDVALSNNINVIFAPQPFLLQKKTKTRTEQEIVDVYSRSFESPESFANDNREMREGLIKLTIPKKVVLIDCSGVFDDEITTTFTDIWHFTDPGHALLGKYLAKELSAYLISQ